MSDHLNCSSREQLGYNEGHSRGRDSLLLIFSTSSVNLTAELYKVSGGGEQRIFYKLYFLEGVQEYCLLLSFLNRA
jgi:hypothetical protein